MISFKELHLQLILDPFYGHVPTVAKRPPQPIGEESTDERAIATPEPEPQTGQESSNNSNVRSSHDENSAKNDDKEVMPTHSHTVVKRIYQQRYHVTQTHQFRDTFALKFFKKDIHRELIYLWVKFLDLPAYDCGVKLDWEWRDFLKNWDADFEFKKEELRDFLRNQELPLPTYFFYDDSDNTTNPEYVEMALLHLSGGGESSETTPGRRAQQLKTNKMRLAWQERIDQLAGTPEHRKKTHTGLSQLVANEPISQGASASTIRRWTKKPRIL